MDNILPTHPFSTRVFIQTCPGRETFLANTLRSFHENGGAPKGTPLAICYDGELPAPAYPRVEGTVALSIWKEPRGNLAAFHAILSFALQISSPGDRILFFEDDISFCKNAVARMLAVGVPPGCAFTSFFDMKEFFPGTPYGLYRVPLSGVDGRGFWGLQAVLFTYETVKTFVESEVFKVRAKTLKSHSDMVLVEALKEVAKEGHQTCDAYAAHVPSLVEHEGADSSAIWQFKTSAPLIPGNHEINRRATNPCPPGFDALALPQYR
jgi:hypothetical protein